MDARSEQCAKTADSGTPITDAALTAARAYAHRFNEAAKQPGGVVMTIPDPNAPPDGWDVARQLERELIQAQYELNMATNAGVIECAIRNKAVAEYMNHWETRAVNAERQLAALSEKS